jgi:hypothetical protein
MARTFGVEIEGFNLTLSQVAAAINAAGVICHVERYGHTTPRDWKVVTDASINGHNGFEVVSPILSGDEGKTEVRKVMDALTAAGAKVNKSCGLHVHIGAVDFTMTEFANIAKNYLVFEDFFDAIMPASRRADANIYIKSLRAKFGDYSHAAARRGMAAVSACRTINEIIRCLNGADSSSRYYKLNLTAFWRHRTIEFRQHSGTTDAEKAINWIELLMAFVEKAATSRPRARNEETMHVPAPVVFSQFFRVFGIKTQRAHFNARRKLFSGEG